jgi:hypothetical protein
LIQDRPKYAPFRTAIVLIGRALEYRTEVGARQTLLTLLLETFTKARDTLPNTCLADIKDHVFAVIHPLLKLYTTNQLNNSIRDGEYVCKRKFNGVFLNDNTFAPSS